MNDPKSAELSAAAARLRRAKNGEASRAYRDAPRYQYEKDIGILADAYLATVAADDGEPLNIEYLWQVLGENVAMTLGVGPSGFTRIGDVTFSRPVWVETRGQLRQLCRALNIALQPIAQETPNA